MSEMKNLGNIRPAKGSNKTVKRLGRGIGSGLGKTAGKGHKGQKARKGCKITAGFEGGQMPLYRRLPKRGFFNIFRTEYSIVNIGSLSVFDAGTKVTPELLIKAGLIKKADQPVKLLGSGKLDKKLTIALHKVSSAAKAAVEKVGGLVEEI